MFSDFPSIRFQGQLRPSQAEVVAIARRQLSAGQRKLHIVAPPGSGKTVVGLYLWAEQVRVPALVLSPNSAIQAQWAERLDLFDGLQQHPRSVSTDPRRPGLFNSLTYQAVTLPQRGGRDLDAAACELWTDKLIEEGQAQDPDEAEVWIDDLKRHNRAYFDDRLGVYRKAVRDRLAIGGEAMETLHESALATLKRLKQAGVGLLILDECHHLLSHWGRVLDDAHRFLDHPIVIGLTATPPDPQGRPRDDVDRYARFLGPVDFEVPVPAVVKDGFLAPYQDLVRIVRPRPEELTFVANADDQLYGLVEDLCQPIEMEIQAEAIAGGGESEAGALKSDPASNRESLPEWLYRVLAERRLPIGPVADWETFARRDPGLSEAGPIFLKSRDMALPPGVPEPRPRESHQFESDPWRSSHDQRLPIAILLPVLDRYIRHRLRRSLDPADHRRAEQAIARLRMLGTQITETGSQACASPIGRLMAYSRGKAEAMLPILRAELAALGDRIRAIVVTDFEKTSAVSAEIEHLLDDEAGGAIAAFRALLSDPDTDRLDPVLVTGSTVLVDDDLAARFDAAAARWLSQRNLRVELEFKEEYGFHVVSGRGGDWCPRVYVTMVTELFQSGLTRCLVGTRGLLGEGWDANKVNVLIDLTSVTTSTSVNQLRGRSLRLDPDDPEKLAHNWDVVCVAPEFTKGLDDYRRFLAKHETLFGMADDGVIQKGVGHVHAAFTELGPELVEESMTVLNEEMLERPARRAEYRRLWGIGQPYRPDPVHALEVVPAAGEAPIPKRFATPVVDWNRHSLTQAIGRAVLGALREAGLVASAGELCVERRAGDYVRAFFETAESRDSHLFSESLAEALGPLERPRYVIRRFVDYRVHTWLSRILPKVFGRYFQKERRRMEMLHAVPSALAKNRELAAMFGRHWNQHVSPGQPVYARSSEGERLVRLAADAGATSNMGLHKKEVFV